MVVYTVITNGYDTLMDVEPEEGVRYVCFTDDEALKSNTWEIKPLPGLVTTIPQNKKQRILKIMAHLIFPEEDVSVYIDGNIKIVGKISVHIQ